VKRKSEIKTNERKQVTEKYRNGNEHEVKKRGI